MAEIRVNSTGAVKLFDNDDSHFVGLQAGSVSSNVTFTLPTADGSDGQFLKTDGSGALSFGSVSSALDDITTGDAASTLATSAGNITIDAQGNDTDIIFKGTDGSSDTTFLTIDGSDAGTAIFNHDIKIADDGQIGSASDADAITINSSGVVTFSQNPVFPDGSIALADLDIDGGTDIGADIVDADLFIIDDGAGGTNRKVAASRIKTYAATTSLSGLNVTINGITEESGTLATGDELLIYDASASANRRINVANFLKSHANHTSSSVGTLVLGQANTGVTHNNTIAGSNVAYSHSSTAFGAGTWRAMGGTGSGDRCCWRRIS